MLDDDNLWRVLLRTKTIQVRNDYYWGRCATDILFASITDGIQQY